MGVKNVDLSYKTNEIRENKEENILITKNNNETSNGQEFKPVQNYQSNLPNVIDVKTTMLGVLGIFRNFGFYCHNCINHSFWYFYCI